MDPSAHERAQRIEGLHEMAENFNLRQRRIQPERGWRLIDIIGAPSRAGHRSGLRHIDLKWGELRP